MPAREWGTAGARLALPGARRRLPHRAEAEGVLLEHERKRTLYGEALDRLEPGGMFVNLEHVASPTPRVHLAFVATIGETPEEEDPWDRLLDVGTQLTWLRELGFEDVDCFWKWREMALLAGARPSSTLSG